MSEPNEQVVVDLVDACVPSDQGLSGLGLLMQLGGNVLAGYATLIAILVLFAMSGNANTLWVFLLLGASIARSLLQRSAGAQLLYNVRPGGDRTAMLKRYLGFSMVHTALFAAILVSQFKVSLALTLGVVAALALWPLTLAIIFALPRFRRFRTELPLPEDKGFEGASILMTVFGLCGVVIAGSVLLALRDLPEMRRGSGVPVMLALAMLIVRSAIHLQAGLSGLRVTSVDRSFELANRYANFAVIASFSVVGALLLFVMAIGMSAGGLLVIGGVCWMLMSWPLVIRRFFRDRQLAERVAGEAAPVHRRAPDAGLTTLGWLLIASGVFTLSAMIPALVAGGDGTGDRALESLLALSGTVTLKSVWWTVGLLMLQLWTGFELVRMSSYVRWVGTAFGVIGAALSVYLNWPLIEALRHSHGVVGQSEALRIVALIIPIATLVLVNRKVTPTARARFRAKPVG